jgi:branched-chain amino acid transport system ATP-binding protein
MLLSANDLTVSYGAITALHGVSVEITAGEIVALIGSNGAGKTTLLRTISGLLRPSTGQITWNIKPGLAKANGTENKLDYFAAGANVDLTTTKPDRIVRLGISHVPEGRQVFANLTVRENLLLGAFSRRDRNEIRDDLEKCFVRFPVLGERRKQASGTLSGGEQQMLAIARALMSRPKLLLLDEPSLGLAPLIVQKIFQIIQEINREGTTIFLVEQNANMALSIANRGYVLQTGQVILSATSAELLATDQVKRAYLGG